ncbi:MAG: cysteine desulfurase [Candidatus Eisenbacteria bacterium]|uniref:cysteine desulfurase n=1 Tax=Eiseniibacteriota bacterium TaxID=2212470 RepID=A0A956SDJ0_UNCEI|nr:cysteine desulfurase [Candidatus Eisenbacteria bacterium]
MRPIYMDNAATTSVDPRVVAAMLPVFSESYGNAASRNHAFGWEAEELVEIARREVASVLGCEARELVFTSGATESDNLALKGVLRAYSSKGRHLITTKVEHPAVLDAATALERDGMDVTRLRVDSEGRVAPEDVAGAIREDTVLVSIIHGNNETGVVQDVPSIASVCRERGVLLHTDATQSFGKIPTDVRALGCDLLSLSGHKIHGPKGVGALFIRRRNPRVRIEPILDGGGHEGGVRSGTANVPGIVGLGVAARLASKELESDPHRIATLLERLERGIRERLPDGVLWNTPESGRLPHILNFSVTGVEGEALLLAMRNVAVSSGSACASASLEPSHVLLALGRSPAEARAALRFSLGRFNTEEEVDRVIDEVGTVVGTLRAARARHRTGRDGGA